MGEYVYKQYIDIHMHDRLRMYIDMCIHVYPDIFMNVYVFCAYPSFPIWTRQHRSINPRVPLHRWTYGTHEPESTAQSTDIGWVEERYLCMCNDKRKIYLYTNICILWVGCQGGAHGHQGDKKPAPSWPVVSLSSWTLLQSPVPHLSSSPFLVSRDLKKSGSTEQVVTGLRSWGTPACYQRHTYPTTLF